MTSQLPAVRAGSLGNNHTGAGGAAVAAGAVAVGAGAALDVTGHVSTYREQGGGGKAGAVGCRGVGGRRTLCGSFVQPYKYNPLLIKS